MFILNIGSGNKYMLEAENLDLPPEKAGVHHKNVDERIEPDVYGNVYELDTIYEAETFDLVYLLHVMEHLEYPTKALRQIKRVMKPDASLIIEIPNPRRVRRDRKQHLYSWTRSTFWNLMQFLGFKIMEDHGDYTATIRTKTETYLLGEPGKYNLRWRVMKREG